MIVREKKKVIVPYESATIQTFAQEYNISVTAVYTDKTTQK